VQERILDAARTLFVKDGYEAVTLRKVAEAIEYTPAALYTHFEDKADLLRALCRQDFGALSGALLAAAAEPDPVERVVAIGRGYVRFAVEHPHHYKFMFMSMHPPEVEPDPEDLADKDDPQRNGYAALRLACADAIAAGMMLPEHNDPELLAQVFWAGVHGVASLEIAMGKDDWIDWRSVEARTRVMTEAVVQGTLTPEAARAFRARRAAQRGEGGAR
jgi:AcrR family transcriptional regulator